MVDTPLLQPLRRHKEEDNRGRLPEIEQSHRTDDRKNHRAEHVDGPLVVEPGGRTHDEDRSAEAHTCDAEVGERVGEPWGARGPRPHPAGGSEEDEARDEE